MKKSFYIMLIAAMLFTAIGSAQAAKTKAAKAAKPISGVICTLNNVVKGNLERINKAEADQAIEKGYPLVLVTGQGKSAKVYFIYNEDGSYAGKNLAKYANNKKIGVTGKAKTANGVNYIIASKIESMD